METDNRGCAWNADTPHSGQKLLVAQGEDGVVHGRNLSRRYCHSLKEGQ